MPLQVIITAANTVSRASDAVPSPPDDHQRHDQRDLDHGDRDRQHQRAERLADPVGDDLGVVHRGEHGPGEDQRDEGHEERSEVSAPGEGQDDQGEDRPGNDPGHPGPASG